MTRVTRPCDMCGKAVTRPEKQMRESVFCGLICSRMFTSVRLSLMNGELNPTRMIVSNSREKLRAARLGKGEGKGYAKTFGKHTHRAVAEHVLGRNLLPGEVVHHINEDKRDNRPENLMVFPSQAEHAAWHMGLRKKK